MKPFIALTATAAVLSIIACGPSQAELDAAKAQREADSLATLAAMEKTWTVDVANSTVTWAGTMTGIKTHTGTLNFASGTFKTKGPSLTGGDFIVDMKNYVLNDTNYAPDGSKKGTKANLTGHLMSADFLAVDSFPTAQLRIASVNGNTASGEFTVRGHTNTETVEDIVITPNGDGTVSASGKLVFDRQKYGVTWSTGAKDMVVEDKIRLDVRIKGNPQ